MWYDGEDYSWFASMMITTFTHALNLLARVLPPQGYGEFPLFQFHFTHADKVSDSTLPCNRCQAIQKSTEHAQNSVG